MTARFVLACLLIALPLAALSQASAISVRVVDPDGSALPRATVRLLDRNGVELARALTDSQGEFRFEVPAANSFTLSVDLVGFRRVTQPVDPGA